MPFTFSHPLYAAPLKWLKPSWFSLTGLVLGSMSPDFEYFLALEPYQSIGHTVQGLFLQAIPLCLIFSFVFHTIVKQPLLKHLPSRLKQGLHHLDGEWGLDTLAKWLVFLLSIIIGFASHVLVDSFTHVGGYFVTHHELLRTKIAVLPIYKWLQYSLSGLGLLLPSIVVWRKMGVRQSVRSLVLARKISNRQKLTYWLMVVLTSMIVLLLKLLFGSHSNLIGSLVVAPITGAFIGILLSSVFFRVRC